MLADSSKDSLDWYRLYNLYVKTFIITSELDSALALSEKTLRYCSLKKERSASDFHLLADIHNSIGNIYATTSTSDSALKYFQKTLEYGLLARDMKTEITAYNNLADVFTRRGDFAQGTYYYRQALHIADSTDIPREEFINTYTGLGICYMELRDFERFNHYFDLAGQMFEQMDLNRQTSYLINRGNGYYYEGRYREALSLFQQGLELVKPTPEYEYIKNLCLVNMGELYLHLDKPDSAQDCLETAYTYFQSLGNNTLLYHAETLLSDLAIRQNNIAKAKMYLQKQSGYDFIEPNSVNLRKKSLQRYYAEKGDYKQAYRYMLESSLLEDSIRNDRVKMRVAEIDLRYKQDTTLMKQQLFIQKQQSDMDFLRQSTYIGILVCVLLFISILFIYFYQKKKRAYLLAQTRNKIIGLRMENIRNRISPHFIFNTLNQVINGFQDSDDNKRLLYNLIKIMRLNLRLTEKLSITLEEELEFIKIYLEIEKRRFDTSLTTRIQVAGSIDTATISLPAMMIQIPVENAMKHGLRDKEGEKKLRIRITDETDHILIHIEDNGIGFKAGIGRKDSQSTGTGLRVLNQTILLLNSFNKKQISMSVQNGSTKSDVYPGSSVKIIIPKEYSYMLPEEKQPV